MSGVFIDIIQLGGRPSHYPLLAVIGSQKKVLFSNKSLISVSFSPIAPSLLIDHGHVPFLTNTLSCILYRLSNFACSFVPEGPYFLGAIEQNFPEAE